MGVFYPVPVSMNFASVLWAISLDERIRFSGSRSASVIYRYGCIALLLFNLGCTVGLVDWIPLLRGCHLYNCKLLRHAAYTEINSAVNGISGQLLVMGRAAA